MSTPAPSAPFPYALVGGIVGGLTVIGLTMATFLLSQVYLGTKDDWETIQKKANLSTGILMGSTTLLGIGALVYLYFFPPAEVTSVMYYLLAGSCLSLGLSYSAFALSPIPSTRDTEGMTAQVRKSLVLTAIGMFLLFALSAIYLVQDPAISMYYMLALSFVSFAMSFSAVGVSSLTNT